LFVSILVMLVLAALPAPAQEKLGDLVAEGGYDALPAAAREYVEYLEGELGADAVALGVGPGREETVVRRDPFE
jgi:adenylosuccinate synthase